MVEGRRSKRRALARYHVFCAGHAWKFDLLLRIQQSYPRLMPPVLHRVLQGLAKKPVTDRLFNMYLGIAPPEFVGEGAIPRPLNGSAAPGRAAAGPPGEPAEVARSAT